MIFDNENGVDDKDPKNPLSRRVYDNRNKQRVPDIINTHFEMDMDILQSHCENDNIADIPRIVEGSWDTSRK